MENWIASIGRVIYGLAFGAFGIIHFIQGPRMTFKVPEYFPGDGTFWVYFTGVFFIAISLSIISKKIIRLSCALLAISLVVFDFTIHIPQIINKEFIWNDLSNFLKDTALAGAALVFSGIFGNEEENVLEEDIKKDKKEPEIV